MLFLISLCTNINIFRILTVQLKFINMHQLDKISIFLSFSKRICYLKNNGSPKRFSSVQ